jgi:hypothetical protein
MPAMTRADIDDLNAFVKAGRIDDARTLLKRFDSETAKNALKRLNERYPPTKATKAVRNDMPPALRLDENKPVKTQSNNKFNRKLLLYLLLVVLLVLVVTVLLPTISDANSQADAINRSFGR